MIILFHSLYANYLSLTLIWGSLHILIGYSCIQQNLVTLFYSLFKSINSTSYDGLGWLNFTISISTILHAADQTPAVFPRASQQYFIWPAKSAWTLWHRIINNETQENEPPISLHIYVLCSGMVCVLTFLCFTVLILSIDISTVAVFFVCLIDWILYVPSTIFQLYRDWSSWIEPVISKDIL